MSKVIGKEALQAKMKEAAVRGAAEASSDLSARFENLEKSAIMRKVSPENNVGKVFTVDINLIDENPFNARSIYLPEIVAERAASIAKNGQQNPIKLSRTKNNRWLLVDGLYRVKALRKLGLKEALAREVTVVDDVELYRISYESNHDREGHSVIDDGLAWSQLIEKKVVASQAEISAITGKSPADVSKLITIANLPREVLDIMHKSRDKFGISIAYEIYSFFEASDRDISATKEIIHKVIEEDLSLRKIISMRTRLTQDKTRKNQRSRQYDIKLGEGAKGFLKDWNNGRIVLDIKIEDQAKRKEILELIKQHMGIES